MPAWYRRGLGDRPQTSSSLQAVRISPVLLRRDLPYVAQFGLELMIMTSCLSFLSITIASKSAVPKL